MNDRRGFLQVLSWSLVAGKLTQVDALGGAAPMPMEDALGLIRTLGTIQAAFCDTHAAYATREEMLLGPEGLPAHIRMHAATGHPPAWHAKVKPDSSEIIPGWELDTQIEPSHYVLLLREKPDANGYGGKKAIVTSEIGLISTAVWENLR